MSDTPAGWDEGEAIARSETMSEIWNPEIEYMEPCQDCGRGKSTPLRLLRNADGTETMAVLCDHCYDARDKAARALREANLLAEWGTIGARRTA